MRVFNLTEKALVYRRRTLPPNGGSFDFLDLRIVPLRDQKLAMGTNAVLAFGSLPQWWVLKQQQKQEAQVAARAKAVKEAAEAMAAEPPPKVAAAATPQPKESKEAPATPQPKESKEDAKEAKAAPKDKK